MRFKLEAGSGPLADALAALAAAHGAPGAVLQVTGAAVQATVAVGAADLETGRPVTADDLFQIGSITKPATATTVLRLAEEGRIDLDRSVADYLEPADIAGIPNADSATIRQLLSMQSGIPSYEDPYGEGKTAEHRYVEEVLSNPDHLYGRQDFLDNVRGAPPSFQPGTSVKYSNTNYVLLELLIESVTDQPARDVIEAEVLGPAGMSDTVFMDLPPPAGQTSGYRLMEGEWADLTAANYLPGAEGGLVAPADDVTHLFRALFEDEALLTGNSLAAMTDAAAGYGLGMGMAGIDGLGPMYWHNGSTLAFDAFAAHLPVQETTVVLLTNGRDPNLPEDVDPAADVTIGAIQEVFTQHESAWAAWNGLLF